ncbi:S8 family serine peptidase [bacterium]|nr:S8 family serine peptidase [bacterium]
MRILAKLKRKMNCEDREKLEKKEALLLFQTEIVDIIGLETEDSEVLKQIDFIEEFRVSAKGIILFNETLLKIGIQHLHEIALLGAGIYISILDSGIFLQDLGLEYSVALHKDFTREGLQDDIPHGTIIYKIIQSIAPESSMLIGKVVNRFGEIDEIAVFQGLEWSYQNKAHIINLSLGFPRRCQGDCWLCQYVNALVDNGVYVVSAAGNWGLEEGSISCPGNAIKSITVGASEDGKVANYSSRGFVSQEKPDLLAPGSFSIGKFKIMGTSISTPIITGTLASLFSKYQDKEWVINSMKQSCKDLGYRRNEQGYGLLNIHKLLEVLEK